jgi:hypothetical protein
MSQPGAPTNVRAVSKGITAIITWTPPVNVGAGITGYTINATSIDGGSPVVGIFTQPITQVELHGLTSGKKYSFIVIATGPVTGASSTASNTVITGAQLMTAAVQSTERSSADLTDFRAAKTTVKYQDQSVQLSTAYTPFKSHQEYIRYLKGKAHLSQA